MKETIDLIENMIDRLFKDRLIESQEEFQALREAIRCVKLVESLPTVTEIEVMLNDEEYVSIGVEALAQALHKRINKLELG